MTLYLDVIWLLNFLIDWLLLHFTALILKRGVSKRRLCTGAFLGACFILFLFTPLSALFYHPLGKLLYSMLIVFTVFGYKRFYAFAQVLFMFYFVTFMIGGGMIAVHYFLKSDQALLKGMALNATPFGDPMSWVFVFIGFPCVWFFSSQRVKHIEITKIRYDQIAAVEIDINDQLFKAKGLIDSGNQLHDPITKTPVMILEVKTFAEYFPEGLLQRVREPDALMEGGTELPLEWEQRLRIIPYRAVGKQSDFLLAVKPDEVRIKCDEKIYTCKRVWIGLNEESLSGEAEFNCIVHPKLLTDNSSVQPAS